MGEWSIYGSNGSQKATVKKLEYSGEFMGETYVTCDVYAPSPISFAVGDYLEYRGERFVIDYDATRKKQARVNTYGSGFLYEGMRFLSYVGELKKCEFLDFVPSDNQIHYSQLPEFSFFAADVSDLAERIQANLDRLYTGNKAWTVTVAQGFTGKTNIDVQVSKITCFDALKLAYDQFEAQFVIRGRTITIGTAGSTLATNYKYGKGNGLKTIERSVDESDALITRLRAYGNTTNMPANYYRNLNTLCYADYYEMLGPYADKGADLHFHPGGNKFANNWFTEKSGADAGHYWVEVSLDEELWVTAIASTNASNGSVGFSVVSTGMYGSNTQDMLDAFNTQLGSTGRLYFRKGVSYENWGAGKESGSSVPASLFIDRLMLPSFPTNTDPYIDSSNIGTLGIREKSVYFDGSDPELPDIHPSLEGMTAHDIDPVHGSSSDYLDEIAADATEIGGGDITTDGQFVNMDEVPGFQVKVKDIGFDINSYLSTETATLSMKSGKCGGREFTIVKVEKAVGGGYLLTCQRTEDINLYFPYKDYPIEAGDKFVLTGIEMPEIYVTAASQRLYDAAVEYLAKHSQPQYVYAIKMDDIWMQRQADGCESITDSYYWNIKEGDVMQVQDNDLGIYEGTAQNPTPISEVIDRLTIREGYDPIPQIEVVLRKEKPQGTIGILQNRIRQLEAQNAEQVKTINRQSDYITLVLGDRINDIANQADHQQISWFGTNTPNVDPDNPAYPIDQWTDDWSNHIGDMYYDKDGIAPDNTPIGYVFEKNNNSYQWTVITDPHTLQALAIASEDKDTIDGKRRVFVITAGSVPLPPYEVGDLWVNAIYPSNNTVTDEAQHKYYNDVLKCITDRGKDYSAAANVRINDWSLASKYTDDSKLNTFLNGYQGTLTDIQNQVDQKAETWYQANDPSTGWDADEKEMHEGDIWYDTTPDSNGNCHTYIYRKSGSNYNWEEINGVPEDLFDTIDGKAAIYVTWNAWGNDLQVKDLFIPSANTTQGGVTYYANKVYRCTNKTTPTFQEIDYTDDAALNAFLNGYTGTLTGIRTDISNAQTTADNANTAAAAAQATADALDYLKQAYSADNTLIDHGLILSTIVALRDSNNNVWSGISGAYDSTKLGNGIAAWYGGGMIDKEAYQTPPSNSAKSLFRFDGSGYVADGNITWDSNGQVTIQGYQIQVGGSNVATANDLSAYLPLSAGDSKKLTGTLFSQTIVPKTNNTYSLGGSSNRWSNVYSVLGNFSGSVTIANSVTLSGDTTAKKRITFGTGNTAGYIEYDASTGLFHFSKGLYSDGTISALGANTSGGGGTGIEMDEVWAALRTADNDNTHVIDASHLKFSSSGTGNGVANVAITNGALTVTKDYFVKTVTTSGSGNAITGFTLTNGALTLTKGSVSADGILPRDTPSDLGQFYDGDKLIYTRVGGSNSVADKPSGVDAFGVITMRTAAGYYGQILYGANGHIYYRSAATSSLGGTAWNTLLGTLNYKSYTYDKTQTYNKNMVLASSKDTNGQTASFRVLDAADIPSLPASKIGSGTLDAARLPDLSGTYVPTSTTWWGQSISNGAVDGTITISNTGNLRMARGSSGIMFNFAASGEAAEYVSAMRMFTSSDTLSLGYETTKDKSFATVIYGKTVQLSYKDSNNTITRGILLNSDGYVGIGTSAPDSKLHVDGTFKATNAATVSTLTLSNTGGVRHLNFSRTSYNYISAPAGSDINFEFSKSSLSHSDVAVSIKDTGLIILANRTLKIGNAVLSWDSTNNCLKISDGTANNTTPIGIYATGTVSTLGANNNSSGGGGADIDDVWAALAASDSSKLIDSSHINISVSGSGNAVTGITPSGTSITLNKGTSFLPLTGNSADTAISNDVYFANNKSLVWKVASGSVTYDVLKVTDGNQLALGLGTSTAGKSTYIYGHNIYLRYGSSQTLGLTLSSSGAVTIKNNLTVDGTSTLTGAVTASSTITATGAITGASIIKSGGTSLQFLKANGDVDDSTYLKASDTNLFSTLTSTGATNLTIKVGDTTKTLTNLYAKYLDGNASTWYMKRGVGYTSNLQTASTTCWLKVASATVESSGTIDTSITLAVTDYYIRNGTGILVVNCRRNSGASEIYLDKTKAYWISRDSYINLKDFALTRKNVAANKVTFNLYVKKYGQYKVSRFTMIDEGTWSGKSNVWTLYNSKPPVDNDLCFSSLPSDELITIDGTPTAIYSTDESYAANAGGVTTTQAATTDDMYILGVTSSATNTIKRNANAFIKGNGDISTNGNITVAGEVTASSDERKKNIISNTKFNVRDIASARSVLFEWNDDRDKDNEKKIHGGSIAQDWLGKADSFLTQDNDGWYSINYGSLALCSAITIAKEVVKHEDRITLLEKENAKLKARVAELEERRIA